MVENRNWFKESGSFVTPVGILSLVVESFQKLKTDPGEQIHFMFQLKENSVPPLEMNILSLILYAKIKNDFITFACFYLLLKTEVKTLLRYMTGRGEFYLSSLLS